MFSICHDNKDPYFRKVDKIFLHIVCKKEVCARLHRFN
nr:MAG TPA: hypothetical protein [Bacteriophage sp.]